MSQQWLMVIVALLAASVVAEDTASQDENDERFLSLVRNRACVGPSCGSNDDDRLSKKVDNIHDSSFQDENDAKEREIKKNALVINKRKCLAWSCRRNSVVTRRRTSSRQKNSNRQQSSLVKSGGQNNKKNNTKREDLGSRGCRTLRCRSQNSVESAREKRQARIENKKGQGTDSAIKKRKCMAWNCKKRFINTRVIAMSKKSRATGEKRCMAWNCKKRSRIGFTLDSATRSIGERKREKRGELEQKEVRKTRGLNKPDDLDSFIKKRDSRGCMSWKCRGRKRTLPKKERESIDTSKRIIDRKQDKHLGLMGEKCRGWECLTKRMRDFKKPDALASNIKKKDILGCITWMCYGRKRTLKKKKPAAIDISKRIIGRKQDKDLDFLGLLRDGKCRGLNCLKKRKVLGLQQDMPSSTKCLSWDCDKRKADSGELSDTLEKRPRSTTQDDQQQFQERKAPQYAITDEYKDMIKVPIRPDVVRRILPRYFSERSLPRTLQKEDFLQGLMVEQEGEKKPFH